MRDAGLAAVFGLGMALDALNMALAIPLLVTALFPGRGGARISGLVTPLYAQLKKNESPEAAARLAGTVFHFLVLVMLALSAFMALFPHLVARAFAPGFGPEALDLMADLLRWFAIVMLLWGIAGFLRAFLLANERFIIPTASNLAANALLVAAVFVVGGPHGVVGMAIAFVVAATLRVAGQLPAAWRRGLRLPMRIDWRDAAFRRFLRLLGPVTLGMGITQINAMVDRILGSTLDAGSVSALVYANRIRSLPLELFVVAINQATLPRMSHEYAERGREGMLDVALFSMRIMLAAVLPATVGLIVLREPIAAALFGHGAVDPEAVRRIAGVMACYAVGIPAVALGGALAMAFFTMQDTRTPTFLSASSLAANVILNLILIRYLGVYGLALATAVSAVLYATAILFTLRRRLGSIRGDEVADAFLRPTLAAAVMGAICWGAYPRLLEWLPGNSFGVRMLALAATVVLGTAVYIGAAAALRVRGVSAAWTMLRESGRGRSRG